MKKLFLLLPLMALLALTSVPETLQSPEGNTQLNGKIVNPKGDKIKLSNLSNKWEADVKDGHFELSFEIEEAGYFTFAHGNETSKLYLEPGDDVSLSLDPNEFDESIRLSGKGAEESNYLFSKYLLDEGLWEDYKSIYSLDSKAFVAKVNDMHQTMMGHFKDYCKKYPQLNATFKKLEKVDLVYQTANTKLQYPEYYQYFTKSEDPVQLPEDYLNFINDINLNDESQIDHDGYNKLLANYIEFIANRNLEAKGVSIPENSDQYLSAKFEQLESKISNTALKQKLMYRYLSNYISYEGVAGVDEPIATFKKTKPSEKRLNKLNKLLEKARKIGKGQPAPSFSYPDIEGSNISLETLKGRYIYIDVWATWCGPCLKELPHLEELQDHYKGNRNIAFTSISIDKNEKAWRKMVTEKQMKGIQLIGDKAWESQICKDYMINGIPRFILIDKEGKILDANAPRPSSDELKATLSRLLGS